MRTLTPSLAAELADSVYRLVKPRTGQYLFRPSRALEQSFEFDFGSDVIKATTGGFLPWLDSTTGFA